MAPTKVEQSTRITQLYQLISEAVAKVESALLAQNLLSPSFDEDAPSGNFTSQLWIAQNTILDATTELHDLLLDPLHLMKAHAGVSRRRAYGA